MSRLGDEWEDLREHVAQNWKVLPESLVGLGLQLLIWLPIGFLLYMLLK